MIIKKYKVACFQPPSDNSVGFSCFTHKDPCALLYKASGTWLLWDHVTQSPVCTTTAFPALLECHLLHSNIPKHGGGQ